MPCPNSCARCESMRRTVHVRSVETSSLSDIMIARATNHTLPQALPSPPKPKELSPEPSTQLPRQIDRRPRALYAAPNL